MGLGFSLPSRWSSAKRSVPRRVGDRFIACDGFSATHRTGDGPEVQRTLDHISEAVAAGKAVKLRNLGVFEVKVRKARIGRNPNQPDTDVPIPRRAVVKFKPGKEMREAVWKSSPPVKV